MIDQLSEYEMNRLCNEVLSAFEIREARLLNWGFINGSQVLDDIDEQLPDLLCHLPENSPEIDMIWQKAKVFGITGAEILQNLEDRKLIFRPNNSSNRYRSRFAETVRTLYLLRQRFSYDDWRTGERLVSDMRLLLQRRRYPRRNITADALLEQLRSLQPSSLLGDALRQLLQEEGQLLQLAQFQAQSILQILRNLRSTKDSAVVIGAGTGSGKTKAFYLPALAHIAAHVTNTPYVQALALYPRKELLKDQLREAYLEARKLDDLLKSQGQRPITVGAYYGDVPNNAAEVLRGYLENWRPTRDKLGWICPYIVCPRCQKRTMAWLDEDLKKEVKENQQGRFGRYANLWCFNTKCAAKIDSAHLLLTRQQMVQQPPDILFTTTEMLNRRLSNPNEHPLFGVGVERPPRLLLLDEIHLHEGIHGAQVAHLLRRWRHARGEQHKQNLCIVGLSATLTQAESFFSRLTGVPRPHTTYITPAAQELVQEGIEYNLVLKGDPSSGATLLSTSVRTAMLLCRVLDPLDHAVAAGAVGQRVFAFSDKLDVINRWYHIEKEVENPTEPYVRYLYVSDNDRSAKERSQYGQNWWFIRRIHGSADVLHSGLRLDITSSQYEGVDEAANLVIATSTLEVGYNDPTVGAVLQHKTPFSRAAFIQRKGRAGRQRMMRPWMVLVASAYGHDRWAFQHIETLFDSVLPPLYLPLENYYVRKIQATYALLDWLALKLKARGKAENLWDLLRSARPERTPILHQPRQLVIESLRALLTNESTRNELKQFLHGALGIEYENEYAVDLLLWGEPRPLLFEVIPTMLRQLESDWQTTQLDEQERWRQVKWSDTVSERPLPAYLPAALFSDLKSPDLLIRIPEQRPKSGEKAEIRAEEALGIDLALSEFAPGKVNKRFAFKDKIRESHWLQLPERENINGTRVRLEDLSIAFDPVPMPVSIAGVEYQVFRPYVITLGVVPSNVRPTSSARCLWQSRFLPCSRASRTDSVENSETALGTTIAQRPSSPWQPFLHSIKAYTQVNDAWVEVTRLATGVDVYTRYEMGGERRAIYHFTAAEQPAAIGFRVDVDALQFSIQPIDVAKLRQSPTWPQLYRHLGVQYFRHRIREDERLQERMLSDLEVEWLWQLELTMTIFVAVERRLSLAEASTIVQRERILLARQVLSIIFRTQPMDECVIDPSEMMEKQPAETSAPGMEGEEDEEELGYLQIKLLQQNADPVIQAVLADHVQVLWDDNDPTLCAWVQRTYAFSLGAAIFATVVELTPDVNPDELYLDVTNESIWISEAAAGGIGLIAKIADTLAQHPRQFDLQLAKIVKHCSREQLALSLNAIAAMIQNGNTALQDLFEEIRKAMDLPQIERTQRTLTCILDEAGVIVNRQLGATINSKFLRPNSGPDTDHLLADLVAFWQAEQMRLQCDIDLRIIAAVVPQIEPLRSSINRVLERIGDESSRSDANQLAFNLVQSLLWMHCHDSCPDCIERPQRYQSGPKPSRMLLRTLMAENNDLIHCSASNWYNAVVTQLATVFHAHIVCQAEELSSCTTAVRSLLTTPVEVGYQISYPVIERMDRNGRFWSIHLILPELIEE